MDALSDSEIDQPRFVAMAQDADGQAEILTRLPDKFNAAGGLADSAGRDSEDVFSMAPFAERLCPFERF